MAGIFVSLATACAPPPAPPEPPAPRAIDKKIERQTPDREARVEVKMPALPADASCRQARSAYVESWALEDGGQRADLTQGQFAMVLGRDSYFSRCNVSNRYEVSICAAVQNGQVLGATVSTSPRNRFIERCVDRGVRGLDFPVHPRMDVTTTVFRAD